jgi:hypothetical protein
MKNLFIFLTIIFLYFLTFTAHEQIEITVQNADSKEEKRVRFTDELPNAIESNHHRTLRHYPIINNEPIIHHELPKLFIATAIQKSIRNTSVYQQATASNIATIFPLRQDKSEPPKPTWQKCKMLAVSCGFVLCSTVLIGGFVLLVQYFQK